MYLNIFISKSNQYKIVNEYFVCVSLNSGMYFRLIAHLNSN